MKKKKTAKKAPKKIQNAKSRAAKTAGVPGNTLGVTPLGDKVLVKPIIKEAVSASGIILTSTKEEKPETGMVVAVGPGRRTESGAIIPVGVQVGDKIMFSKYGFDEVKVKGEEYYLIGESSIQAIID